MGRNSIYTMGSVITYDAECPKCKEEKAFSDYYYRSGEEYFFCQNESCSYSHTLEWKRDSFGKFITKDGTENTRFDNLIMVETTVENGTKTVKEYK